MLFQLFFQSFFPQIFFNFSIERSMVDAFDLITRFKAPIHWRTHDIQWTRCKCTTFHLGTIKWILSCMISLHLLQTETSRASPCFYFDWTYWRGCACNCMKCLRKKSHLNWYPVIPSHCKWTGDLILIFATKSFHIGSVAGWFLHFS